MNIRKLNPDEKPPMHLLLLADPLKKTRRLASPAFGRRKRRSPTYSLFLKFLATSSWLPARNLYFLKVQKNQMMNI